jgi:uncharacterized membrane protein YgdD (TMEM256/DUF423 family)
MSPMANFLIRSLPLVEPLKPGEASQRGTTLYVISVVMVVVAGLFVVARISVRLSKMTTSQGLGQDDYCVVAALVIIFLAIMTLNRANWSSRFHQLDCLSQR